MPLIGTAGCYDAVLAFELEAPWAPKLAGSRASDPQLDDAIRHVGKRAKRVRLLAVEPHESCGARAGAPLVRVLWLSKPPGGFACFERREFGVARDALAETLVSLACDGNAPRAGELETKPGQRDLLVCTHGARDACCGKFGYPIFRAFRDLAREREASSGAPAIRVWRSSHLGGHRFAPTMMDLPSGRVFGRVTADDTRRILDGGDVLVARLEAIYRGRCVLPEAAQVVERNLWIEAGAPFEAASLVWRVDGGDEDLRSGDADAAARADHGNAARVDSPERWRVDVAGTCGDGRIHRATSGVERARMDAVLTPASCGRDPEADAPWKLVP